MKFRRSIISHIVLLAIVHGTQFAMKREEKAPNENLSPSLINTIPKYIKDNIKDNENIFLPYYAQNFLNNFKNYKQESDRKLQVELSPSLWEKIKMVLLGKGPSNKNLIDPSTKLYFNNDEENRKDQSKTTILDVLYSINYINSQYSKNINTYLDTSTQDIKNYNQASTNFFQILKKKEQIDHNIIRAEMTKLNKAEEDVMDNIKNTFENAPSIISFNDLEDICKRIVCVGGLGALFFFGLSELAKEKVAEKIINYLDIRNIYIRSGFSLLGVIVGIELASRWLCSSVSSKIERRMTDNDINASIEKNKETIKKIKNLLKIETFKIEA